ncbi:MAG: hypothetical protein KF793_09120 [Nitrospira sp.]|nr:hypothetical protein [Nitrospira sp.]
MTISQEVYVAGREVASATDLTLPVILNDILGRYLGWPLKVRSGYLIDRDNRRSPTFPSVIYAAAIEAATSPNPDEIHADNAAIVIDAYENLDLDKFLASCARIAKAKKLRKSPAPNLEGGIPLQTTTLGIIFALRSMISLDQIAEELGKLNTSTPSSEWPDMVLVNAAGTVNYAVQFPGESLSGDLLPPAPRARDTYTPPTYIIIVIRPSGDFTFNRMLGFLIGQLFFFSPGVKLPNLREVVEGVPNKAITYLGFQYNLAGELVPVPRQFYADRYLSPLPMRIEDSKGNLLATISYLPWQDGGTILLRGELPLEPLLVFLGVDLSRAGVIKREELQIAYVLPITLEHFSAMLARIQQQSNMVVRRQEPQWTIQKVADEGTQSPFITRLFMSILKLRDLIKPDPAGKAKFDLSYEAVFSPLQTARKASKHIVQLWEDHSRKVISGEVARLDRQMIRVDESIDEELKKEVESFVISAGRTLKEGMQKFVAEAEIDIKFLFQKTSKYEAGLETLEVTDRPLANYLRQTRISWSERLQKTRNDIEHEGWILPRIAYSRANGKVIANQPFIAGQPVTEFVAFILDRLVCFVEELTVHCIQKQVPRGVTITEIALSKRLGDPPERFRPTVLIGGEKQWEIAYHTSMFEET